MIYEWKTGTRHRGDAQVIGETVACLAETLGGIAPPEAIVEEARNPESPLHPMVFRLNRDQAAESWYKQEARQIVNDITIVIEGSTARPAAFLSVNVIRDDGVERGYARRDIVLSDDTGKAEALAEALATLNGWRRRYRHLSELDVVFEAIDCLEVTV